jgi:uncharacterized protein
MRVLERDEARQVLLSAAFPRASSQQQVLEALGCIQLDPIDRIGTNPDLVLHARVGRVRRGSWSRLQGFEHFAKERCLLPWRALPYYRKQSVTTPWWRLGERWKRLDPGLVEAVYQEVVERGSVTPAELSDHGAVKPLDWSGWKSTAKAGNLALEALWIRCRIVCQGRRGGQRVYRLPPQMPEVEGDYFSWALRERVRVAGLLSVNAGPWWSSLSSIRKALPRDETLERVQVAGRSYLKLVDPPMDWTPDARLRILGPLDPLIWNRRLVKDLWDFDYVWEVYKPKEKRRYGYYVCPLLWKDRLVGRIEGRRVPGGVEVVKVWGKPPKKALDRAVARLGTLQ